MDTITEAPTEAPVKILTPGQIEVKKKTEMCLKLSPPSVRCGPYCLCILEKGHMTPHRARCGSRWKERKHHRK